MRNMEKWQKAKEEAPDEDLILELHYKVEEAKEAFEAAEKEFKIAVVKRACVNGWVETGKEINVSAKKLHYWHKIYCPEIEDLSTEALKYYSSEKKRIDRMNKKAELLKKQLEETEKMRRVLAEKLEVKIINK